MSWNTFLRSKITTGLLILVLVLVGFFSVRIMLQKRQIDAEIKKLQAQADKIRGDNAQLSSLIKYMNTPEFTENEAREKLDLKKDGEYVVVLPQTDSADSGNAGATKSTSNIKMWFQYFFHNQ
ncbi:MAG TPA: septum formation initiator family protein [Methylomirabilota bacterium]|nr:septum formation initiator family protein [Methylomirabilota bacterium]